VRVATRPFAPVRTLGVRVAFLLAAIALCTAGSPSGRVAAQRTRAASGAFAVMSDEALAARITAAREEARASNRRVLLEFVASWCADCREVVRLSAREPARSVLAHGYVVVPVEVGRFDRHLDLIERYGVRVIATLVVLDPATGARVAQTTLEPITGSQVGLTSADLAAWLTSPTPVETRPTRVL
jgi:thiol:disulfide interchange protein